MSVLAVLMLLASSAIMAVLWANGAEAEASEASLLTRSAAKKTTLIGLALPSSSVEVGTNVNVVGTLTTSSGAKPIEGATIRLSVTLPNGSVVYPDQGARTITDSNGQFSIDYAPLVAGAYKFGAIYSNTRYYTGTTSTVDFMAVAPSTTVPVNTAITLSGASSVQTGSSESISGFVRTAAGMAVPEATVSIEVSGPAGSMTGPSLVTADANGEFEYAVTPSTAGVYTITASFAGNAQYGASSASMQFTATDPLPPLKVDVVLTASGPSSVEVGSEVKVTGSLRTASGAAIGGAVLTVRTTAPDGTMSAVAYVTTGPDGSYTYSMTPSIAGTYTVRADYGGDATHEPSSQTAAFMATDPVVVPPAPAYDYMVASNLVKDRTGATVYTASDFTVALRWAASQAGKVTYVPSGTYVVTAAIVTAPGTTIYGDGPDPSTGTVFHFTSHGSYNQCSFKNAGVSDVTLKGFRVVEGNIYCEVSGGVTVRNLLYENIVIETAHEICPAALWTYVLGAGNAIDGYTVRDVHILNTKCMGFLLAGTPMNSADVRTAGGWVYNVLYEDCTAIGCGSVTPRYNEWCCGFDLAEGVNVRNVHLVRCEATGNYLDGFHIEMWPYVYNVVFDDCVANDNGLKGSEGWGFVWGSRTYPDQEVILNNCTGHGNLGADVWNNNIGVKYDLSPTG